MAECIDITGNKYNRLTVIEKDIQSMKKEKELKGQCRNTLWICKCDCGNIMYGLSKPRLERNNTKSCGCLRSDLAHIKKYNKYDLTGEYGIGYTSKGYKFYFDLEDYDKIKDYTWRENKGYISTTLSDNSGLLLHRLIMNINDENILDHEDRNGLNCRKNNLRITNTSLNSFNKSIICTNKSGIMGVNFDENRNKWIARIGFNKKNIFLGRYNNKEDAIKARLNGELKYFGKDYASQRHLFKKYGIGETND